MNVSLKRASLMSARLYRVVLFAVVLVISSVSSAQESAKPFYDFDDHTVVVTVFSSDFLQPDIAQAYGFSRGKDQGLMNLSVIKRPNSGANLGLAAKLSGTATNLMQQQTNLKFVEIKERDAVYYLAPFRFINEEIIHFDLNVQVGSKDYDLTFTKKLYVD